MKILEFQATLRSDDTLCVPPEVARQFPRERPLRVLILVPGEDEDREWEQFTAEEFAKGYADGDAIYDQLSVG